MTYARYAGLLAAFLLFCVPVSAQNTEDFEVWDSVSDDLGLITEMDYQVDEPDEEELKVRLGVIGGLAPEYRGDDAYRIAYAP